MKLVGFRLISAACGNQARMPTHCYHPENRGRIGYGGGKCVKNKCPIWDALEKSNRRTV